MAEFDKKKEAPSRLFNFVRIYMKMAHSSVLPVMVFGALMLCASTSLLITRQSMPGWFHSTLHYMATLQDTDPDIHQEFMDGNFAVSKKTDPTLC